MGALDWELEREGALHSWPHPSGMEPVLLSWWTEMWTRAGHESGATDHCSYQKLVNYLV